MAKPAALRREISKGQTEKEKLRGVHGGAPHSAHEIDRMIHERLRLGIISALAANESLTFNELKHTVKTTDGNLSVHARKLEDAGYINCIEIVRGPHTKDRVQLNGRRPPRPGTLSRSHGSIDWANA